MSKNINHLQHVKSNVVESNQPKLPGANVLVEGELAVNYATGFETISLKNNNGEIVRFSSDEYYTATKLGSGFTGANSANTVTSVLKDNEEVIAEAYNDLNNRKLDASAYTPTDLSNYYTKSETSGKTELENEFAKAVTSVTSSSTNGNISVNGSNVAVHGLGTAAYRGVSNGITNSDNLIESKHIYSGVGVTIAYDNSTNYIQLKNTSGGVISSFDASAFLVDGMVDSVTLESKSGTTYLVITWNTAAGKQNTELNIGDIFEADNYYTATEIDDKLGSGFTGANSGRSVTEAIVSNEKVMSAALNQLNTNKADLSALTEHTSDGSIHLSSTEKNNLDSLATNIATISGITSTDVANWNNSMYSAGTASQLSAGTDTYNGLWSAKNLKDGIDALGYTKNDGTVTKISTANGLTGGDITTSGTIGLEATGTAGTYKQVVVDEYGRVTSGNSTYSDDTWRPIKVNGNDFLTDTATPLNLSGGSYITIVTGATGLITISGDTITEITSGTSASTLPPTTSAVMNVIKDNEEIISSALNDLQANKLDASAYTPTDLSNYYTKDETSGATEISTALNGKADTNHTHVSSGITAMTGYAMAASGTPITTSDTLNQAIGKLEKMIEEFKAYIETKEEVIAASLNDLNDRLETVEDIINNS